MPTPHVHQGKRSPSTLAARALFTAASIAALFTRFLHRGLLLGFFQDDFFYYLKIADNLALRGISSFDGVHRTNGYHPLWLFTLAGLRWCFHGPAFFVALQTLTLASALLVYLGVEQIFRTLHLPQPLRDIATVVVSMQALLLLRYGMEVTLALPLGMAFVALLLHLDATAPPRRILGIALLGSLTILARLDAALLVFPLLLAVLWTDLRLRSPRSLLSLLLGLSPLPLYLAINLRLFHLLLPVSALAKQLKTTRLPSASSVLGLVSPIDRFKLIFVLPCLILLALGLLAPGLFAPSRFAKARSIRALPRPHRAVLLPMLLFPILQVAVLSFVSDWNLWPWYFYTFVFSSTASIAMLARPSLLPPVSTTRRMEAAALALALAYLVYIGAYSVLSPNSVVIYTSSKRLADYMDLHPGIYAMGDQAGMTGYLSLQPLLQTEGLVMDAEYLGRIKRREPLREILADYNVRYYVALSWQAPSPCLSLREPGQAGPHSLVSEGVICSPPLATFYRDNLPIYVFDARAIQ